MTTTTEAMRLALEALEQVRKRADSANGIGHLYEGDCPAPDQPDARDAGCPACKTIDASDAAITALRAALAAAPQPPQKTQAMPAGWVPLHIEWEHGYPEDVAYGPPLMMERLKKWLDKHFAVVTAAPAAQQGEALAELVALELERLAQDPPINGNTLAQVRVLMTAANVREFGIAGGAALQPPAAQQGEAVSIRSGMCQRCGKWAGAHATLPGHPTDHLCRCQPSAAPQPTIADHACTPTELVAHESPNVSGKPTGGSPDHLLQDQSRGLSQWLASQPDARLHAREAAAEIAAAQPVAQGDRRDKIIADLRSAHDRAVAQIEQLTTKIAAMSAAAPAGVVGEPVAWMYDFIAEDHAVKGWLTTDYDEAHSPTMQCHNIVPLYAAPPARQALTDEQVQALIEANNICRGRRLTASDMTKLALYRLGLRDGERAHGIKDDT